jgi:hypothetical protein
MIIKEIDGVAAIINIRVHIVVIKITSGPFELLQH